MVEEQRSFSDNLTTGTLYLVPTPIGNLGDFSQRAIEVLNATDMIAAEDTRHTQQLLNHFDIKTEQISLHEHNYASRIPELIEYLLNGKSVAQVSDAGTPSISDPGHELVVAAIEHHIPVVPVPGPTATLPALIASGLTPQPFTFLGFLPRKETAFKQALETYQHLASTLIIYESPHRLKHTLEWLRTVLGDQRRVVLARELTKKYESFLRGTLKEVNDYYETNEPKGEYVVIIDGHLADEETVTLTMTEALAEVSRLAAAGEKVTQAVKIIAKENNLERQALYQQYLELNHD